MRIFVALPVQGEAAEELTSWAKEHRTKLSFRKWTHPRDYHITLQFLGEWPEARLEELHAALRSIRFNPIKLALNGGGAFGPAQAPRVLWAALAGEVEALKELHREVVQATKTLGFVPEERRYAAHITLARSFTGNNGGALSEIMATMPVEAAWEADRFVLMRTHMNASPMYEVIGEYGLGQND
ncbi:RNA 2',3'-cyclic phosphodiesterase [Paenibacillus nanensis]|uniref:RNA 2',3'-cyclic phosphodiesterase n=1 Tax=Paenibacillus nanensis TaxID=393251 RepID=A0A3A1VPV0_9BACL|nr:RNA 2',3'-cyclic phosphodiesterase [Paenibacillus nanensis]RIX59480.1 RNA 2',3'-cyclic phosphodiesterase [Paenibacillus nanensis]